MEIPPFKPSKKFVDDVETPCLVAKVKSSQLPHIAVGYRAEIKKDPTFEIFLRGGEKKITPWQQKMLDQLFTRDGLVPAIEKGLKLYQSSTAYSEDELDDDVKRDGLLAHVYLRKIIVDDARREVMLAVWSIADGNLDEHGLVVHGDGAKWVIEQYDYISEYLNGIDPDETSTEKPAKSPPTINDLVGRWVLDEEATTKEYRKQRDSSIKQVLAEEKKHFVEVSDDQFRSHAGTATILGFEIDGRRVLLKIKTAQFDQPVYWGGIFRQGKIVDDCGVVWRRVPLTDPAPAAVVEWADMDATPLLGRWETEKLMGLPTTALEITAETISLRVMKFALPQRWIKCQRNGENIMFRTQVPSGETGVMPMKWKEGKLYYYGHVFHRA